MIVIYQPVQSTDHNGDPNEPQATYSACIIDLSAASARLLAEFEPKKEREVEQKATERTAERKGESIDRVEDPLPALLPGVALILLLIAIFFLPSFMKARMQPIGLNEPVRQAYESVEAAQAAQAAASHTTISDVLRQR
jgi:hypothetical protein